MSIINRSGIFVPTCDICGDSLGKPYGDGKIKSVIIWQYRTLYTEVFMIEQR